MKRFKIYGVSSTIVVSVIAMGVILYLVFNNILALLFWLILAALAILVVSALLPRFYRQMSETVDLRDNAINSRKAEIAGLICTECKRAGSLIGEASRDVDTESAKRELERLEKELESMKCCTSGFSVEPEGLKSVDFTFLTTKSAEVRDRLGAIKRSVHHKYAPIIEKRNSVREAGIKKLVSSGFAIGELFRKFEGLCARKASDLEELVEKEQEMGALLSEVVDECTAELKRIANQEQKRKGFLGIEQSLSRITDSNFTDASENLSGLRMRLRAGMEGDFFQARDSLTKAVSQAEKASRSHELSELNSSLNSMLSALKSLDDPGRLSEVRDAEKAYRELASASIERMSERMKELRKDLSGYPLPRELSVKQPPKLEVPRGGLQEFTRKFASGLSEGGPALEELSRNARIIQSYPKAEKLIEGRLAESGKVLGRDLDIRYPEIFFALYRKNRGKVKFIQEPEPKLVSEK